jgi:Uma2 family endonuclease
MLAERLSEHDDTPVGDWTSGGIRKLDIYAKLGVREVWIWRRARLTAHAFLGERYQEVAESRLLPGIDLAELAGYLDRPTASQAIREYRALLQSRHQCRDSIETMGASHARLGRASRH